jgi:Family of unknown function (DUF6508)
LSRHEITREDIDALLEFLPLFEQPGREFAKWPGSERNADGSLSVPFPVYDEDVEEFFGRVGRHGWIDYGYKPEEAARMLEDDESVGRADIAQVKMMLTYCVRSERFGDGNWQSLLKGGRVAALLRRLAAIRAEDRG